MEAWWIGPPEPGSPEPGSPEPGSPVPRLPAPRPTGLVRPVREAHRQWSATGPGARPTGTEIASAFLRNRWHSTSWLRPRPAPKRTTCGRGRAPPPVRAGRCPPEVPCALAVRPWPQPPPWPGGSRFRTRSHPEPSISRRRPQQGYRRRPQQGRRCSYRLHSSWSRSGGTGHLPRLPRLPPPSRSSRHHWTSLREQRPGNGQATAQDPPPQRAPWSAGRRRRALSPPSRPSDASSPPSSPACGLPSAGARCHCRRGAARPRSSAREPPRNFR